MNTTLPSTNCNSSKMQYLAIASCLYPTNWLNKKIIENIYNKFENMELQAIFFLGDNIYIDADARTLKHTTQEEDLYYFYRSNALSKNDYKLSKLIPRIYLLDDHEIYNNWQPLNTHHPEYLINRQTKELAVKYFLNKNLIKRTKNEPLFSALNKQIEAFYNLSRNFILLDTRTDRDIRNLGNIEQAKIISDSQMQFLANRILTYDEHRKSAPHSIMPIFIASASALVPRHKSTTKNNNAANALNSDSWDGYPKSLCSIFKFICDEQLEKIIFLCGDEHISSQSRITITAPNKQKITTYSITSSALHAPLPFANSKQEDLIKDEIFYFNNQCKIIFDPEETKNLYTVDIKSTFSQKDGFAVVGFNSQCLDIKFIKPNTNKDSNDMQNSMNITVNLNC